MSFSRLALAGVTACTLAACSDTSPESFRHAQSEAVSLRYNELCAGVFAKDFSIKGKDSDGNPTEKKGALVLEIMPNIFDSGVELMGPQTVVSYEIMGSNVVGINSDGSTSNFVCRPELK